MASKSRGGLSKNEVAANKAGQTLKAYKAGKSTPVLSGTQAKKAASSSVSKESKSLASAQKEYLASLAPSGEETAAITANQNILMGQEQETRKIAGQAIASPFIERQTGRLNEDTESKVIPLKYQIAALQNAREARGNIAQAKMSFAKSTSTSKATNPLDEEYKQLRNENMKQTIAKNSKSGKTPAKTLAASNTAYNQRKTDDSQRGFVTLPKGMSGPPAPKVLKKKGRSA